MDKEYLSIVSSSSCHESKLNNALLSFLSGGLIGLISEVLFAFFNNTLLISENTSYTLVFMIWITLSSILTGLGIFDNLSSFFKAGIIVPSTGFAHAMTSSAMDGNKEGLVTGIGPSIFKLTGSIILYGVVFSILFAFLKGVML